MEEKVLRRCEWAGTDPLYAKYHDREWGTALHNDRKLFELLVLECMQAGLSWITILRKRENYRKALDGFDYIKISKYGSGKILRLLSDPGIIRNRAKVESIVANARAFIKVREEFGSFDGYVWRFAPRSNIVRRGMRDLPAKTVESEELSNDLKMRGFKFVGPTTCYSFMQATGMVNDHLVYCFRSRK